MSLKRPNLRFNINVRIHFVRRLGTAMSPVMTETKVCCDEAAGQVRCSRDDLKYSRCEGCVGIDTSNKCLFPATRYACD